MPEQSLYICESDLEQIAAELLAAGCVLIPDETSEQPEAREIHSLEAFRVCRSEKKVSLFFAVSKEWGIAPFEWGKVDKNGVKHYFIRQKSGGPTLDIFAPFLLEEADGSVTIPHGFIAYHATFWNPLTNRSEKPPSELKVMHKRIVEGLRSEGEQLRAEKRTYLVAKGAKDNLRAGCSLGPPFVK